MTTVQDLIAELETVATVTPEYAPDEALEATQDPLDELLEDYPKVGQYATYVEFLRDTGGAHIHNAEFSLGLYGFGGYVVAALDEGPLVDAGRYFQFGEVLYHFAGEPSFTLAFDLESATDEVYVSPQGESAYSLVRASFADLLRSFAARQYPRT